ncbi:hypothetical protein Tco_0189870 [Tanacetum coccineum]
MDEDFYATTYPKVYENLKLRTDKHVIEENPESHSGSMSSMKNLEDTDNFGDQFLNDKPAEDDQEKLNVVDKTADPSDQTDTSTPPVTTPVIGIPSSQLRVAKLEQDMSEVKKTDHSAAVLASIQSQVPKVIDKYLGTKIDDALLKALEKHTADLIQKYSMLPGPESSKKQEYEKSTKEFIRIKREQGEKKQKPTYTIKSTDKAALEEYDLKTLIQDENAMDKEVADKVKDLKRKHDSDDDEDDDDDEGPSAGSNQGKSTKRRRHDSGASGSAQPPKDDEQNAAVDSSTHRSDPESKHSEQSSDNIPMQDEGHVSDLEDTYNAHIPKVSTTTWFKPIPEGERPATPEPEWTISPNDFSEPENNWANTYATTQIGKKKLCKADLVCPTFNLVKAFHKNSISLQFQMDECHKLLTSKVDLVNPEGHQILHNIYEPLPLGGPLGQVTIQPQFFFNKDLEYLLTGDKEQKIALSISKLKAARYLDFGLEELIPSLWVESEREYDISTAYGITHWWFRRKEFYINKHSEPSDREAVRSQMRILSVISVKVYEKYGYNYLREIILRRADYKEYKISEKDFKNLHPNDFEDLNRVGDLQPGIESYQTKINLECPNWDAADYYFKEDYTIVPKPRAVVYRDRNDQRKLMRLNELHKFSDGTLTRVMERLDHMVKDFQLFEYNKGMETRKWSEDDKKRSKDFISAIEKILQIRRIFRSLESFVGDHLKMEMEMEIPSSSIVKLITECSDTTYTCYEVMKDLINVSKLPQTLISYSSSQVHKMAMDY